MWDDEPGLLAGQIQILITTFGTRGGKLVNRYIQWRSSKGLITSPQKENSSPP